MSTLLFANNAGSTLAGAITNTATTLSVSAGGGALFPNPTSGQYFIITAIDAATGLLREIMWCTARSTDTFTVVRAQEGTTGLNWNAGDLIQSLVTAGMQQQFLQVGAAPTTNIYYGATDTGATNTIVATVAPILSALADGMVFEIENAHTNTSNAVTMNISGQGAKNCYRSDGSALLASDYVANGRSLWAWNSTANAFYLLNPTTWVSQPRSVYYGATDTGATNTIVATVTPTLAALADGQLFEIANAHTNSSGSVTMNLSGTGTLNCYRSDGSALLGSDYVSGGRSLWAYDSATTAYYLLNPTLWNSQLTPQVTVYSTGSGTYTKPTGATYLTVRMVGGGSGGGGSGSGGGAGVGTAGAASTFGTALLTANGGPATPAVNTSTYPTAAAATGGDINITGGLGGGSNTANIATGVTGFVPPGASSPLGAGGAGGATPGLAAAANATGYGSGGGAGGFVGSGGVYFSGWGGNAGAYLEKLITAPSATYAYAVGAAGTGGAAGTYGAVGGNGSGGLIIVTAFFSA